jgi:predicted HicB family RNase H-like nuclease
MKKSASSPPAAAARRKSSRGNGTITSLDGAKKITLREFDRLFDEGSDLIDAFIDWSKAKKSGGRRPGSGRKPTGRKPYQIRLKPETHLKLQQNAARSGTSISQVVEDLVARA